MNSISKLGISLLNEVIFNENIPDKSNFIYFYQEYLRTKSVCKTTNKLIYLAKHLRKQMYHNRFVLRLPRKKSAYYPDLLHQKLPRAE